MGVIEKRNEGLVRNLTPQLDGESIEALMFAQTGPGGFFSKPHALVATATRLVVFQVKPFKPTQPKQLVLALPLGEATVTREAENVWTIHGMAYQVLTNPPNQVERFLQLTTAPS